MNKQVAVVAIGVAIENINFCEEDKSLWASNS